MFGQPTQQIQQLYCWEKCEKKSQVKEDISFNKMRLIFFYPIFFSHSFLSMHTPRISLIESYPTWNTSNSVYIHDWIYRISIYFLQASHDQINQLKQWNGQSRLNDLYNDTRKGPPPSLLYILVKGRQLKAPLKSPIR